MTQEKIHARGVVIGTILGTLITGASISLLKSKRGKRLQRKISDKYHEYNDRIEECLHDFHNTISENFAEQTDEWKENVMDSVERIKEELELLNDEEHKDLRHGLCIGGLTGCLCGFGGALLLKDLFGREQAPSDSPTKKVIEEILGIVEEKAKTPVYEKKSSSTTVNNLVDLTVAGLQLWKKMREK